MDTPILVGLTNNQLTGAIPKSLERFEALSVDLVGNSITEIPEELCQKGGWLGGFVQELKCDAIVCRLGTYNPLGHTFGLENPCVPCATSKSPNQLSSTICKAKDLQCLPLESGLFTTWKIVAKFYIIMAGEKWTIKDGWEAFNDLIKSSTTIANLERVCVNVCNGWYRIIPDSDQQVTDISLANNELYGVILDQIFTIPMLQVFDISNNIVQMVNLNGASQVQGLTSMLLSNVKVESIKGVGECRIYVNFSLMVSVFKHHCLQNYLS